MKPLFYILPVFLIVLGGNCARKSSISIVCPDPQIVEVTEFPVAISDLQLQGPELGGECLDGGFSYFIPEYEQITEGKNTLTYVGQNAMTASF